MWLKPLDKTTRDSPLKADHPIFLHVVFSIRRKFCQQKTMLRLYGYLFGKTINPRPDQNFLLSSFGCLKKLCLKNGKNDVYIKTPPG